jgi:hypothetical protein
VATAGRAALFSQSVASPALKGRHLIIRQDNQHSNNYLLLLLLLILHK